MRTLRSVAIALVLATGHWSLATAQNYNSPPADTSATFFGGKKVSIAYHSPQMHGRKIFGGLVPYGEVWRAGANEATALHTDADLQIGNLHVPKGDYTLFVLPQPAGWQLIINKQTGQWGLEYHQNQDLGRVPMDLQKSPTPIDSFKITIAEIRRGRPTGNTQGTIRMEWESTIATVPFIVK